jgi:hypothetical protein
MILMTGRRKQSQVVYQFANVRFPGTRESSAQVVQASRGSAQVAWNEADDSISEEQLKMNDCYSDHKDWRACKKDVSVESPTPLYPRKVVRRLEPG